MKTKLKALAGCCMAAALGFAGSAQAGLSFDPDGTGGGGAIDVAAFDWQYTSFLAQGGTLAIATYLSLANDGNATTNCSSSISACNFNVLTHATLSSTTNSANATNNMPGLGTSYEITLIAKFTETVTGVGTIGNQTIATFGIVPSAGLMLEVYYDSNVDSNALTGYGFNDGTLILTGSLIQSSSGSFGISLTDAGAPVLGALDQSGSDNYGSQQTVIGQGSQGNLQIGGLTTDPNFFKSALEAFGFDFANISIALPFISVDPSDCFTTAGNAGSVGTTYSYNAAEDCDNTHVSGPYSSQGVATGTNAYTPVTGAVNGFPPAATQGPDFVAQTDFNSPVQVVPEPGMLTLLGAGLIGLAGANRRRRTA